MTGVLRLGIGSSKNVLKETVLQLTPLLAVFPRPLDFTFYVLLNIFFPLLHFSYYQVCQIISVFISVYVSGESSMM